MTDFGGMQWVAHEVVNLVRGLPPSIVDLLVKSLEDGAAEASVFESILNPHYRVLVADFLRGRRTRAVDVPPAAVALALLTASLGQKELRENQCIELVWTGPDAGEMPLRRTEQAILQVIDSAARRLTVVSYAVYNIQHVRDALVRAAARGVAIDVVLETPDKLETEDAYSTIKALGPQVADRCSIYLWPLDKRPRDEGGRPGLLHVKCAVADGRLLLLTSANLTGYAFTVNMELGVLISGGDIPLRVERHFDRLIQSGVLGRI